jgi:hypothetical protein
MANDFEECRIEVIGRREYDEENEADLESEDFENRNRKPTADETDKIMSDYKDGFDDGYRFGREEIIEKLREIDITDIDSWLMDRLADMIEGGDI